MLPVNTYRQFVAELTAAASRAAAVPVSHVRLAVTESQLVNVLRDLPGVIVAGNIPGTELLQRQGYRLSQSDCILLVLQHLPPDRQATDDEFLQLARLQRLMSHLLTILADPGAFPAYCPLAQLDTTQPLRVEWEYNQYGGFHGLSLTFRLTDPNGPALPE